MKQSSPIRIIIVDDHPLLRDGIRYLCLAASDVTLVEEAVNGEEALVLCNQLQPDVVLMDFDDARDERHCYHKSDSRAMS